MAEYLLNCWYAAAFGDEVADKPFAVTLLDQPVVIFRDENGVAAMLDDRCPHRFAPLSQGPQIGNTIQCPYHGLRFDTTGACVANPHAGGAPLRAASVRSYPVLERYGVLWFWPGDPERADPSILPTVAFLEEPDRFRVIKNRLFVRGNYQLISDNLLDLSHAAYIHPQFGADEFSPDQLLAATTQRLEVTECSVINHRMRSGLPSPRVTRAMFGYADDTIVHRCTTMKWYPPAVLDFPAGVWALDEEERDGALIPQLHLVTPETEFTSHYLFLNGRNRRTDEPEIDEVMMAMFLDAFRDQDEPMIEAVQKRMGSVSNIDELKPILLKTDAAPVSARRLLAKLIAQERAEAGKTSAVNSADSVPASDQVKDTAGAA